MGVLRWLQQESSEAITWDQAQSYFEEFSLVGHYDWRLPTMKELLSITPIDSVFFPNTDDHDNWSSAHDYAICLKKR